MHSISVWWLWFLFFIIVTALISVDLFWLKGGSTHRVSTREALGWSITWVVVALLFNVLLWWYLNRHYNAQIAYERALEFFTSYLVEKSLSVDNLFVFILIFRYFGIVPERQKKLLLYGVISAVFLRLIIIVSGIWLLDKFEWIFYVFGVLLLVSAVRMLFTEDTKESLENNYIVKITSRLFRVSHEEADERFFFYKEKHFYITPLLMALIFIEISDLIFAMDSIPAVFAITRDPFIAFTSNVFAVMGLRAMYFLMANIEEQFHYLRYGLVLILLLIAAKMLLHGYVQIPVLFTLSFIVVILSLSIFLSIYLRK